MGRKRLDDDERREKPLRIRLKPEEREAIDKASGGNSSAWAREVLLKAAKKPRKK
jgi:hypothetical protein